MRNEVAWMIDAESMQVGASLISYGSVDELWPIVQHLVNTRPR
jgi:hypothetical protein